MKEALSREIEAISRAYAAGELEPHELLDCAYTRLEALGTRPIWTEVVPKAHARALLDRAIERKASGEALPLFGIPFAVKDNIDLAGFPTTAGCPAFARTPKQHAAAVARLVDAGAIPLGKTNLDQFATGLVGTRSPYGTCASAFDARHVSGGSSSGSALAVAHGIVSFSLGTDTAGSGRVPAAFNNLVGWKPTRGLVSTRGVVPACRSLDCVSVFAGSVGDTERVASVLRGLDAEDPFSRAARPKTSPIAALGVPARPEFFGDREYERLFAEAVERARSLGARIVPVELEPFLAAARLLYGGPWVAERYAAVGEFIEAHPDDVHPVVREIVLGGRGVTGADAFRGSYRLAELKRAADRTFESVDALLLPTAPFHPTIEAVLADPIELNAKLGFYTNFVNLLDLAALAVPAGFTAARLPFGVTLVGPAFSDGALAVFGDRLHRTTSPTWGASGLALAAAAPRPLETPQNVLLAVAGAHLSGQPLNHQLTTRHATLVRSVRTAPDYRLFALAGTTPPKPGLVRTPGHAGPGIELEVWSLTLEAFGSFVAEVPPPMVIGTVELADATRVKGFLCEPAALEGSADITHFGGWRAFLASRT
ncbi:MAG TPA: allophanate hydrolase [Polyangiaceae bacterium]|nr:allophanate hydrolase [Polyangiaceae bacterium]